MSFASYKILYGCLRWYRISVLVFTKVSKKSKSAKPEIPARLFLFFLRHHHCRWCAAIRILNCSKPLWIDCILLRLAVLCNSYFLVNDVFNFFHNRCFQSIAPQWHVTTAAFGASTHRVRRHINNSSTYRVANECIFTFVAPNYWFSWHQHSVSIF